jgi:hypothetical protein
LFNDGSPDGWTLNIVANNPGVYLYYVVGETVTGESNHQEFQ